MLPLVLRQMASLGASRLRTGAQTLGVMAGIGVCVLMAAGFGLAAVFALLRPVFGTAGAYGLLAAGMLIVAQGLALWLTLRRKPQVEPVALPVSLPVTDATVPDPFVPPQDLGTQAAFLVGFLLARRLL